MSGIENSTAFQAVLWLSIICLNYILSFFVLTPSSKDKALENAMSLTNHHIVAKYNLKLLYEEIMLE